MRKLEGQELEEAIRWMDVVAQVASKATCRQVKCGAVIVKGGQAIGRGYNSPPNNDESQRRCHIEKSFYHERVTDKTCCMHAEQRAIMDALANNPKALAGARLYFSRLEDNGELKRHAGQMYCSICSKMSLDAGIKEFVLWHNQGIFVYDTNEYNDLTYAYTQVEAANGQAS